MENRFSPIRYWLIDSHRWGSMLAQPGTALQQHCMGLLISTVTLTSDKLGKPAYVVLFSYQWSRFLLLYLLPLGLMSVNYYKICRKLWGDEEQSLLLKSHESQLNKVKTSGVSTTEFSTAGQKPYRRSEPVCVRIQVDTPQNPIPSRSQSLGNTRPQSTTSSNRTSTSTSRSSAQIDAIRHKIQAKRKVRY